MKKGMYSTNRLYRWELALLLALCISFCVGTWAQAAEEELSGQLIRLHVIAASDSEEDQALKLQVRDAVLEHLAPLLKDVREIADAREILRAEQANLRRTAAETAKAAGRPCSVSVGLGTEPYPTREYEDFSLPAGTYLSLRVILGDGQGQNWWCVVYPPLCTSAVQTVPALNEETAGLIQQSEQKYIVRFRILEWWGNLKQMLED